VFALLARKDSAPWILAGDVKVSTPGTNSFKSERRRSPASDGSVLSYVGAVLTLFHRGLGWSHRLPSSPSNAIGPLACNQPKGRDGCMAHKILLVDDSDLVRRSLRSLIDRNHELIETCLLGRQEAVQLLHQCDHFSETCSAAMAVQSCFIRSCSTSSITA
jgi:hypothetical protein